MIIKDDMKPCPELAVTWVFSKMLKVQDFLSYFIQIYLDDDVVDIQSTTIVREYCVDNKKIDLCIFIEDFAGKKYIIAVEAKVHWPDKDQLVSSVAAVKIKHPDHIVTGIFLLSTLEQKQLDALPNHNWPYPVLTMKTLLDNFCLEGIKRNYSLHLAACLQSLLSDV